MTDRSSGATMLTGTTAILETARLQLNEEFGETGATWVSETRHHIDKALAILEQNTGGPGVEEAG